MTAKTVLITGCSQGGIGDALAREFRSRGHTVFATSRNAAKMASLSERGIETVAMDVTSPESISKAVEQVRQATGGKLDILINNAGINYVMPFADSNLDDIKQVFDTNIFGVFAVTHAFLPLLIASKGVIATVGSVNQVFLPAYQAAYSASKAAITAFGHTLRVELAPFGVNVVTIVTGAVSTRLFENTESRCKLPEGSLYTPIKERIEKRDFLDGSSWTTPEDYAKQVASDLLTERPKALLWRAANSTLARVLDIFGWVGMLDGPMLKRNGLDTIKHPSSAGTN